MAVLGQLPFQFVQTRAQLPHLLPQLLVLSPELRILLSQVAILSLKLFDLFFLAHDSILILQVKGALYSHLYRHVSQYTPENILVNRANTAARF